MDLRASAEVSRYVCPRTKDVTRVTWLQAELESIIKKGNALLRTEVD